MPAPEQNSTVAWGSGHGCRVSECLVLNIRPRACVHRAKLMVQNPNKQSQSAKLAREQGARITHILPLDASGHHTLAADSGVWGCIGCNLC
jgi:hypothetical protein